MHKSQQIFIFCAISSSENMEMFMKSRTDVDLFVILNTAVTKRVKLKYNVNKGKDIKHFLTIPMFYIIDGIIAVGNVSQILNMYLFWWNVAGISVGSINHSYT